MWIMRDYGKIHYNKNNITVISYVWGTQLNRINYELQHYEIDKT